MSNARGHNKQKRDDLRQVGVARLCSCHGDLPLWHQVYGGQVADATCLADVLPAVRQRLVDLHLDVEGIAIVYDKGNVSRANQALVEGARAVFGGVVLLLAWTGGRTEAKREEGAASCGSPQRPSSPTCG